MDIGNMASILQAFRDGHVSLEEALNKLRILPYENLEFAKLDHHRSLRQGFAEVVFCEGKTIDQVVTIIKRLGEHSDNLLATRASQEMFNAVHELIPDAQYHVLPKLIVIERKCLPRDEERFILVITAGTSDIPVAEEAAVTAEIMGNLVKRVFDVGVAGIHRLFDQRSLIEQANVVVVVAGMEGALASVVGGMVAKPVIAVPTSVGYGASFGGLAALLSMLNSCAAGVGVVNIDNGFGAGRLASIINHMR
ncbi:MAG TPA: nickel pincer cofactor biosynthesis protein LarB [Methylomusa anaerophila]|uniref:AIR carboxylase n=1 Tax=Methylomusa anaerophila TaxID=1930071 RepID=A0A348AQF8_9FIRM|nr:nickel pincer cofactor biosynthesis protein LarB [Methylomusa anaerophila]BBB93306.1 AIR carboxylase [Methylomusa anaerophila]HML86863.1 nickel pincer cofactor biosynthesis protein LarB [Methylomusa anaerophila]